MARRESVLFLLVLALVLVAALPANAQSFRVQCPTTTITHPNAVTSIQGEPLYNGPTQFGTATVNGTHGGYVTPTSNTNGAIKCQQISGGDGLATMADGTQTYMFSFGPLSGLADIAAACRARSFRMSSTRRIRAPEPAARSMQSFCAAIPPPPTGSPAAPPARQPRGCLPGTAPWG